MTREVLMAPHVARFEVWHELAASLDEVWNAIGIDDKIEQLKWLRSPISTNNVVIGADGALLNYDTVPQQTRDTLIKTADLIGFRFYDSSLVETSDFIRLCRGLAEYYYQDKGTQSWTDFLSWCFNSEFIVQNLWTRDYVHFYEEGDALIGTPITEGGEWYPTTHVIVEYDMERFVGFTSTQMVEFLNYFANINLVIWLTRLGAKALIALKCHVIGMPTMELMGTASN